MSDCDERHDGRRCGDFGTAADRQSLRELSDAVTRLREELRQTRRSLLQVTQERNNLQAAVDDLSREVGKLRGHLPADASDDLPW